MQWAGRNSALWAIVLSGMSLGVAQESGHSISPLVRTYSEGERTAYHMTASNKDVHVDLRYEASATSTVKKNKEGVFVEDFEWTELIVNKNAVQIPTGKNAIHQLLSRDPSFKLGVPDLSKVPPTLIGPITDLLTLYADLQLAARDGKLMNPGDHFYFKHGVPASWADGSTVLVGEDSIDFDVSLADVETEKGIATTIVKHVPPEKPQIRKVADWTSVPVANSGNNWIQVVKLGGDDYLGQVGKETFDVNLKTSLADGRLISVTIDNVVEVLERPSKTKDLSSPGAESRYRIVRTIEMHEMSVTTPAEK